MEEINLISPDNYIPITLFSLWSKTVLGISLLAKSNSTAYEKKKKKRKNKVKKVTVWNKNSTGLLERFQEQDKHFYSRKE